MTKWELKILDSPLTLNNEFLDNIIIKSYLLINATKEVSKKGTLKDAIFIIVLLILF